MKILTTSDWHIDNQSFGGRDTRLQRSVKVLRAVNEWCVENVDAHVICGDLFEKVHPDLRVIWNVKQAFNNKPFCYLIQGNHDSGEMLCDSPTHLLLNKWNNPIDKDFHCIDYSRDSGDFLASLKKSLESDSRFERMHSLIFCHQYFEGLYPFRASDRVELKELKELAKKHKEKEILIFSGHYHRYGYLKVADNLHVYSIGIPICQTFGDYDESCNGLLIQGDCQNGYTTKIVDLYSFVLDMKLVDSLPEFIIVSVNQFKDFSIDYFTNVHYYRIDLGEDLTAEEINIISIELKKIGCIYKFHKAVTTLAILEKGKESETKHTPVEILDKAIELHKPEDPEGVKQEALGIMGGNYAK